MKRISEKKLEAFTMGQMVSKRQLSKKELEEQKKKEDEEAAAHAFKEFVETFQETPKASSKVWIKAGTYDAGSRREDNRDKGKLYKPGSKSEEKSAAEKAQEYAKMLASDLKKDSMPSKKKNQEKKKSNLELFKEELRQIQEEREERHKYKSMGASIQSAPSHVSSSQSSSSEPKNAAPDASLEQNTGSHDNGDPNTTNLYLGNLSPKISEQQLMEIFGRYGPLASIKIMWPRSEEEKQRGRNCGFVAYMARRDAERALKTLQGRYIMGFEMRLGWGKSVPILNQPIFIPPTMLELIIPPAQSGLPFNAQLPPSEASHPLTKHYKEMTEEEEFENLDRLIEKSVVKVFIPTEKTVLNIIHRMIEFVIREGPMFEALIMSREIENPLFSFLFDNESPAHIYYRWKLFSLLQGDSVNEWTEKEFRMFKNGSIWRPPVANFYTQGMGDEYVNDPDAPEVHRGALSIAQRDRLEDLIRHLTPERQRIGDAMIFCIEHADAAEEICECIAESLSNPQTAAAKKIARLYLISDILHNCTVKVSNASFFRKYIELHLVEIFENLHTFWSSMESRLKAEGFKSRVLNVLKTWDEWAVYSKECLGKLRCGFLGKQYVPMQSPVHEEPVSEAEAVDDIDGAPLSGDDKDDEDLDGVPLDGAALLKAALMRRLPEAVPLQKETPLLNHNLEGDMDFNDDIDGMPLDDDIDGIPLDKDGLEPFNIKGNTKAGAFIPSKWETVDPDQIEAQAVTTSKWDTLDPPNPPKMYDSDVSEDGGNSQSFDEEKRLKLREIEMKSLAYQDELESGNLDLKPGYSVSEMVELYRKRLLKKTAAATEMAIESPLSRLRKDSESPDSQKQSSRKRMQQRSASPSSYRSVSPTRASRKRVAREDSPPSSVRSHKSSRRHRSRSASDSPKRQYSTKTSSSSRYRSPSPDSRSLLPSSPTSYSTSRSRKEEKEYRYESPPPSRHRSDKHKSSRHKY